MLSQSESHESLSSASEPRLENSIVVKMYDYYHSPSKQTAKKTETEIASFSDRLNTLGELPTVKLVSDSSVENICIAHQGTKKTKTATFI